MQDPLRSWLVVALIGAVGGFVGTWLPGGMDVPLPTPIKDAIERRPVWLVVYHVIRNVVCGALASVTTWVLYGSSVSGSSLSGPPVTAQILIASLISGGAGSSLVSGLFSNMAKSRIADDLNASLGRLAEKVEDATTTAAQTDETGDTEREQ